MMKLWWATTFFWIVVFSVIAFISVRKVNCRRIKQTPKLSTFIVLGAFTVFVLLCQIAFLYFVKRVSGLL